ncbi:MAG: hypothetical protein IRZ16_02155 [Myxococcaceae bacterium]|nr:hypothetical protein [Myxococcaceae bacterium]
MKRALICSTILMMAWAGAASAGDTVYVVRSEEDPASPADPAVCAQAPFAVNVMLGASLYSVKLGKHDGEVKDDSAKKIGTATACIQLTTVTFPEGLQQQMYAQFDLPDGTWTGLGTCTIVSNSVPQAGVVLAGCALKVLSGPAGTVGGTITSNTVFNPLGLPGFDTGSYWTLLSYDDGSHDDDDGCGHGCGPGHGHGYGHHGGGHPGHGFKFVEDTRPMAVIESLRRAVEGAR